MKNLTEQEFRDHVFTFQNGYDKEMIEQFNDYWTEPDRKGKMLWEKRETWDTKRRLKRWFDNQILWHHGQTNVNTGNTKKGTSEARVEALRNW